MAKTAVSQLQEQIEAIRREAFAAGFEAAMQSVRQFASTQTPDTRPRSAEPARRRASRRPRVAELAAAARHCCERLAAGSGYCRQAAARHECPARRRGTAVECAASAAPGGDPQHDPAREGHGDRVHFHSPRAGPARGARRRRAGRGQQHVALSRWWQRQLRRGWRRRGFGTGRVRPEVRPVRRDPNGYAAATWRGR